MKTLLVTRAATLALLVAAPAFANDSVIEQIGTGSTATVDQTGGSEGVSTIDQTGTSLKATVTQIDAPGQGTPAFGIAANTSDIDQFGTGATATVTQTGDPGANPGNLSEIRQYASADPQIASVTQDGSNIFSRVEQGRIAGNGSYDRNGQVANVFQTGSDHISDVLQRGNDGDATVTQTGTGNDSGIVQGGLDNTATVMQGGTGNVSTIGQSSNFSTATVTQTGNGNGSDIRQDVYTNRSEASVLQDGNDNDSTILQTSSFNGFGSGNQMAILEQGTNGNSSAITQSGGSSSLVNPGGPLASGNTAMVYQNATAGNTSTVTQAGAGNLSTVNQ